MDGNRMDHLREPPQSLDSEQAVLGGLMLDPRAIAKVSDWLAEEDFYRKDHRLIYKAICELAEKNLPCDAVTLGDWFESNGLAELVGGSSYVLKLANTTASAANIVAYAEIVQEKARQRKIIDITNHLSSRAYAPKGMDAATMAAPAAAALSEIAAGAVRTGSISAKSILQSWYADLQTRYDQHEQYTGILTPWEKLNDLTLGLQAGDLIVLAGRSNMGKSAAAFQIAVHHAVIGRGRPSVHLLEGTAKSFMTRSVAALGRVSFRALQQPSSLNDEDWRKISEATTRISASALCVDDQAGLTAAQVCGRMKRQHAREPLTLAVVDHGHAIKRPGKGNTSDEIGDVFQRLKDQAKELHIPIIALCQFNRQSQVRNDHRPTISDLRGSGDIEQIADLVIFIHREDHYDKDSYKKGSVEFIIGKGRDIETGSDVLCKSRYDQMRIDEWEGPAPTRAEAKPKKEAGLKAKTATHPRNQE